MRVTPDNYFDLETDRLFMSNSQRKEWGECPRRAFARLVEGDPLATRDLSDALAIGSVVDCKLSDPRDLERVCGEHKDSLFTTAGKPSAAYKMADAIVEFVSERPSLMGLIERSEKQEIFLFRLGGMPWKIKLDLRDVGPMEWRSSSRVPLRTIPGFIWDMKCLRSLTATEWSVKHGRRIDFVTKWGYETQLALQREAVRQNIGEEYAVGLFGIEKPSRADLAPDVRLIPWPLEDLPRVDSRIEEVLLEQERIRRFKEVDPADADALLPRCDSCQYCKRTRTNFVYPYKGGTP